ncbi:hypothetical protein BLAC_00200 [Bifidobacterium animalis subsp. lactis ATCC 27673]|nr:hypothetical protein BLAC_00200 [Bifidobacterium animalis subsp. lactis ATCC 27673]KOA48107.1 hypothetical protein BAAA27673_00490 [Bifidobacterium animalis subsp. lactis ATCC 27673]
MPQYPEGKPPYDPFTVAGFILAFLFPPVGLPLSIIGIRNTHDGLKRSEGLAIAGVAISACSLLLFLSSLHGKALIIAGVIIAIIAGVPCLMLLPKSKKSQGWDGGNAGNMNVGGMVAPPYAQQPAPPVAPTAVAPPMAPPMAQTVASAVDAVPDAAHPFRFGETRKRELVTQFIRTHVPAGQELNPYVSSPSSDLITSPEVLKVFAAGSVFKDREWFARNCRYWTIPDDQHDNPHVHGVPGGGLQSAVEEFGADKVEMGTKGEMNLMKLMVARGLTEVAHTFWSLRLPGSKYDTDVDCAVMYADRIWLIDAKLYTANPTLIYSSLGDHKLIDVPPGTAQPHKTYELSKSMSMAMEKYTAFFPGQQIIPVLAFAPGMNGAPAVAPFTAVLHGEPSLHGGMMIAQSVDLVDAIIAEAKGVKDVPLDANDVQRMSSLLK